LNSDHKGIFRHPNSANFHTSLKRWDAKRGKWKWFSLSTHTADPIAALKFREEMQALEFAAAKHGDSTLTRDKAFETVNSLLRWHGIPEISDDVTEAALTWKAFADPWLADIKRTVGEKSWLHHRPHLTSFAKSVGEDSPIASITRRQVQDWYNGLADTGPKASTIFAYLKSVRRVFADAIDEGHCSMNPAMKLKTLNIKKRKKEPFTAVDLQKLAKGIGNLELSAEWFLLFNFGICLGARLGDCNSRRWEEITLEGNIPHIAYTPSKTKKHEITVNVPLVDPLLSLLRETPADRRAGFVTPTLALEPVSGRGHLSQQFIELMDAAAVDYITEKGQGDRGIDWKSKSFHSFRHTLPSLLAADDVPEQVRMGIIGHSRLETHLGYTHHDDRQMREALEKTLGKLKIGK